MIRTLKLASIFALFILGGCVKPSDGKAKHSFVKNGYNLVNLQTETFHEIHFKLSDFFEESNYSGQFVMKNNSKVYSIPSMNIYFSVELFTPNDIISIRKGNYEVSSDLTVLMDHYIYSREKSLSNYATSIRKQNKTKSGLPLCYQTIKVNSDLADPVQIYEIGAIDTKKGKFVFQFFGNGEPLAYLHDDFLKILRSVYL
jgi:hypothetical protein